MLSADQLTHTLVAEWNAPGIPKLRELAPMKDLATGGVAQVLWQELLGTVGGNYFMLTGQVLDAQTALDKGVVAEVLPPAELMARAWAHADRLAALPELVLRYTRLSVTQRVKRRLLAEGPQGYALISLAALEGAFQ